MPGVRRKEKVPCVIVPDAIAQLGISFAWRESSSSTGTGRMWRLSARTVGAVPAAQSWRVSGLR